MARTLAVLKGATPAQAIAEYPGPTTTAGESPLPASRGGPAATATPVGGSTAGTTYYTPTSESSEAGGCCSTTCSEANDAMSRPALSLRPLLPALLVGAVVLGSPR